MPQNVVRRRAGPERAAEDATADLDFLHAQVAQPRWRRTLQQWRLSAATADRCVGLHLYNSLRPAVCAMRGHNGESAACTARGITAASGTRSSARLYPQAVTGMRAAAVEQQAMRSSSR